MVLGSRIASLGSCVLLLGIRLYGLLIVSSRFPVQSTRVWHRRSLGRPRFRCGLGIPCSPLHPPRSARLPSRPLPTCLPWPCPGPSSSPPPHSYYPPRHLFSPAPASAHPSTLSVRPSSQFDCLSSGPWQNANDQY